MLTPPCGIQISRIAMVACLGVALLATPYSRIDAQVSATLCDCQGWAFGRLGAAHTRQLDTHGRAGAVLVSAGGGVAGSYRSILAMVRATDAEAWSFDDRPHHGMREYAALAGMRSTRAGLFFAAAAGVAQVEPLNDGGLANADRHLAPTFDLSAHADSRVGGLALSLSGTLGPPNTRYFAISLGAELGWFGRR